MNAALLARLVLADWRHHPWRHAAALLAVAVGIALAWSVHLINRSALAEFSSAVRAANGDADLTLAGAAVPDALFERAAADPAVTLANPVLEIDTYARRADGRRVAVKVLGIDVLRAGPLAPALVPRADDADDRLVAFDPGVVFTNAAAAAALDAAGAAPLALQSGPGFVNLRRAGTVALAGPPALVMDLAGAQQHFGAVGRLSRVDLRLEPGTEVDALLARLALPEGVQAAAPSAAEQRVSNLSRAYRVNLTVLALVALFVGAFLVYSVVSLNVAQRTPQLALLGVLGLPAAGRRRLVLGECTLIGLGGGALGVAAGTGLAALALARLAGDLGGGYFPGIAPPLAFGAGAAAVFLGLGLLSAWVGGLLPALAAERLAPAQALKGLGEAAEAPPPPAWPALLLLVAGAAASLLPPVGGLPLAAYAAVALLLVGGVALIPAVVHGLLSRWPRPGGPLALLALERARHQRGTATAAVSGVVASLALAVAITVMVASFRDGVAAWLDTVLPADLYARSAGSSAAAAQAWLPPALPAAAAALPGVQRVEAARVQPVDLAGLGADAQGQPLQAARERGLPPVVLVARPLSGDADPASRLPLLATPLALPPALAAEGVAGVFVSEAIVALYGLGPGSRFELPLAGQARPLWVRGVWRDYTRQFGTLAVDLADWRRWTGDERVNDLALWLEPGADAAAVQTALRGQLADPGLIEFASSAELRSLSLRIFDRSFAVTVYLQAVAIAIGLVGIAASLSAQVLARRKEFGLLAHLGLTRRQVVGVVAGEALAWVAAGVALGLALGVAISLVLVFVVNPQSFHWTMELVLPWARLAALALAVLAAGVATAALTARNAAGRHAVLAVKEDW